MDASRTERQCKYKNNYEKYKTAARIRPDYPARLIVPVTGALLEAQQVGKRGGVRSDPEAV